MTKTEIMRLADAYATQMVHAHYHPMMEARAALEAALDELTQGEPVVGYCHPIDWKPHESERVMKVTKKQQPQYGHVAPVAPQLAEPAGEPVAWLHPDGDKVIHMKELDFQPAWVQAKWKLGTKLYTTPPAERRPLTLEQMNEIYRKSFGLIDSRLVGDQINFVRAIEAAIKEQP